MNIEFLQDYICATNGNVYVPDVYGWEEAA